MTQTVSFDGEESLSAAGVKAVENTKELGEDGAGGVGVFGTGTASV